MSREIKFRAYDTWRVKMSNFYTLTRLKGSDEEYKEAAWYDNYFGPRHYGVRFRGTTDILDGDEYEIKEVKNDD